MTIPTPGEGRTLLFFCTRQNPADFAGFKAIMLPGDWVTVEVPCSGRVGTGELMQGLAAGYEKVAVLSCGAKSCIHEFGCVESKKAMDRARDMAATAGIDATRLVFIEADDPEIDAALRSEKKI
jgi:coenzyme F420-reducing hydrogenase delta subunit